MEEDLTAVWGLKRNLLIVGNLLRAQTGLSRDVLDSKISLESNILRAQSLEKIPSGNFLREGNLSRGRALKREMTIGLTAERMVRWIT